MNSPSRKGLTGASTASPGMSGRRRSGELSDKMRIKLAVGKAISRSQTLEEFVIISRNQASNRRSARRRTVASTVCLSRLANSTSSLRDWGRDTHGNGCSPACLRFRQSGHRQRLMFVGNGKGGRDEHGCACRSMSVKMSHTIRAWDRNPSPPSA